MPIAPVDSLEVQILVDNATDMLSSTPSHRRERRAPGSCGAACA